MIKVNIAETLMRTLPISKLIALQTVDVITNYMGKTLLAGHRIEIRGFGVFETRPKKRGMGRNIKTGINVNIPSGQSIRFKPGKNLRDIVINKNYNLDL